MPIIMFNKVILMERLQMAQIMGLHVREHHCVYTSACLIAAGELYDCACGNLLD